MASVQDSRPPPYVLMHKPTSSFSSISSAASATSAGTVRSGGSRLLFGEIDTSSDRSSDSYASVCSLVLSDSSTFLRFWLTDDCRDNLISHLPPTDLANLRLVCHDFGVRAAPALFADLNITFTPSTFTKPSRLAALQRVGFHVNTLTFNLPHGPETFLPPLVDPETGDELSFTYTPNVHPPALRQPKYGDWTTTEILTRQYPPLFHAATNVSAFISAFSAFVNLSHLTISCPGYDTSSRFRRSTVDFALISLRIAIERNSLNALDTLTLSPIHPGGLLYLSPLLGYGATPSSIRRWSRIHHLTINADTLTPSTHHPGEPDQAKLLHTYLCNFKSNLRTLILRWNGDNKGPIPFAQPSSPDQTTQSSQHPAHAPRDNPTHPLSRRKRPATALFFPKLRRLDIAHATASAHTIAAAVAMHARTLEELDFKDVHLTDGTWERAFAPLAKLAARSRRVRPVAAEMADIPIMLAPSAVMVNEVPQFPRPMSTVEPRLPLRLGGDAMRPSRASPWLGPIRLNPAATRKVRQGLLGCEEQVRKVLRTSVFNWKEPK